MQATLYKSTLIFLVSNLLTLIQHPISLVVISLAISCIISRYYYKKGDKELTDTTNNILAAIMNPGHAKTYQDSSGKPKVELVIRLPKLQLPFRLIPPTITTTLPPEEK